MAEEESQPSPPNKSQNNAPKWLIVLIIALVAIALFIIVLAVAFVGDLTGAGSGKGKTSSDGTCSILFPSGAGSDAAIGKAIDDWIAKYGSTSPLRGKGILFAQSGRSSNINPAFIAAISRKESSFGAHIPDTTYNPFGRTTAGSQPGVKIGTHTWYKFGSWDEAITAEGPFLKRVYADNGLTTISAVVEKYCPRSDCDTDAYIKQMGSWLSEITTMANGALGTACTETGIAPGTGGSDQGMCLNSKPIVGPPIKNSNLAQATLADKLAALWAINKTWRVTEACPPSSKHQDKNHYNGRAVDIALTGGATEAKISQLLTDIKKIGFDDVLDEYHTKTTFTTGGHIHLEWHGN